MVSSPIGLYTNQSYILLINVMTCCSHIHTVSMVVGCLFILLPCNCSQWYQQTETTMIQFIIQTSFSSFPFEHVHSPFQGSFSLDHI